MARKHRVWRFQRSTMNSDIISAMTHDRQMALHFPMTGAWLMNFNGRQTFYAIAQVVGSLTEPRLRLIAEVEEESWK